MGNDITRIGKIGSISYGIKGLLINELGKGIPLFNSNKKIGVIIPL